MRMVLIVGKALSTPTQHNPEARGKLRHIPMKDSN